MKTSAWLLTKSERGRMVVVLVAGGFLAFFGVYTGMWWLMVIGIMLPPIAFLPRSRRRKH